MSHIPRTRLSALGVDPDSKATGVAVVTGSLDLAAAPELSRIKVAHVACAEVEGMDARRRLPLMVQHAYQEVTICLEATDGVDAIVVEGMAHRRNDPRPDNIVQLGVVQGITAGVAAARNIEVHGRCHEVMMPLPVDWKGTIAKPKHQAELLRRLGLTADLSRVPGATLVVAQDRTHVIDAIGLALWGLERLAFEEKKLRILR